ncbi:MAG TPA: ABC transporter permease [Planctomycetota bacterium]|jgi:phospholipid/cholesterol/gamma-HCH transport system permease protein|nr:ABC transporter permease [Planctomycetota bacterium]
MLASRLAGLAHTLRLFFENTGGMYLLLRQTLYWTFLAPFREKTEHRRHAFPLMEAIGNKSFGIVALVAFLIGVILVIQTGYILERYGQVRQVSGLVAVTMTRELGPLMTAIVLVARVGAAFTAGIGTMQISDEVLALRTMSINPVGYLVAPRMIAILIMLPCLTIFANIVGMAGGCAMGLTFGIDPWAYIGDSINFLQMQDLISGVAKSALFAVVICIVSCYMAFRVEGGPEGLARNTMVSVVTQLVLLIVVDGFVAAFLNAVL